MRPKLVNFVSLIVILAAGIHFYDNRESRKIAQKYIMEAYGLKSKVIQYIGFYNSEKWANGHFRWSGRRGLIRFDQDGDTLLTLYFGHPDIGKKPVTTNLFYNDQLLDRFTISEVGYFKRCYSLISEPDSRNELLIDVSRTWVPCSFGFGEDRRYLGVAVGPINQSAPCSTYHLKSKG